MSGYADYTGGGGATGYADFGVGSGGSKKKGGGFGLNDLGIVGGLIGDAKDTIIGLPAGLVATATHPIRSVEQIGQSYADTYGHGLGHFIDTFQAHPLGPLLDLATVLTLGSGGVAKAGAVLGKEGSAVARLGDAGEIVLRSPGAKAGEVGARVAVKSTSRNPVIRARETLVDRALKQLNDEFPVFGETARLGRVEARNASARASVMKQAAVPYINAFAKLDKNERRALALLGRVPLPAHLEAWTATLTKAAAEGNTEAAQVLKDIGSEKVQKLYLNPSKAMMKAHAEAEKLGAVASAKLEQLGLLSPKQAEAARYRHSILASGGRLTAPAGAYRMLRSPSWQMAKRRVDRLQKRYDQLEAKGKRGGYKVTVDPSGQAVAEPTVRYQASSPTLTRIGAALGVAKEELARIEGRYGKRADRPLQGTSVDELRAQIAAAGRPQPLYLPDVDVRPKSRGGGSKLTYGNPVNRSDGLLFMTGRLALDPDVLGPQFLRTAVYAHWRDLHDTLLDASVKILPGGSIPDGWVWVKRPPGVGETGLERLIPNPDEVPEGLAKQGFGTTESRQAVVDGKARYAVPGKLARRFEDEFQRSHKAVRWLLEKPTTVWRALVLNLRVAWLVNNVIGNHLLYALRYAGIGGLRGYLSAIGTSKGADAVRRLLSLPETHRALTPQDIAELLPEQAGGTFIGSQTPFSAKHPKAQRRLRMVSGGLVTADKATEGALRRAAVTTELRRHPAVKARLRAMPREARSFRAAARQALEQDPKVAADVSANVNKALGDFLSLGPAEKKYLRAVFPFYAWYKAIVQITFRLPFDTPGRAALLVRLGEVGQQESASLGPLPSYLEGAIPLGGDRLVKTQAVNPFATVSQLGRAAAVPFVPGQPTNTFAGIMNPLVQVAGASLFGRDTTKHGLLADLAAGVTTDLPQVALARTLLNGPAASKLYRPSATDDVAAYFGAGIKEINRKRAAELAAQGR